MGFSCCFCLPTISCEVDIHFHSDVEFWFPAGCLSSTGQFFSRVEDTMLSPTPIFEAVIEEMEKQYGGVLPTAKQLEKELGIGLKECKEILREYKEALEKRSRLPKQPAKTSSKATSKDVAASSAAAPVVKAPRPVVGSGKPPAPATKEGSGNPPAPATKAAPTVVVPDLEETQKDDDDDNTEMYEDAQGDVSEPGDYDGESLEGEEEEEEECDVAEEKEPAEAMSLKMVPPVKAAGLELLPAKALPAVKAVPVVPAKASGPLFATPPCKRMLSFGENGDPASKQLKIASQAWVHGVYTSFFLHVLSSGCLPLLEATDTALHRSMSERRVLVDTCIVAAFCFSWASSFSKGISKHMVRSIATLLRGQQLLRQQHGDEVSAHVGDLTPDKLEEMARLPLP